MTIADEVLRTALDEPGRWCARSLADAMGVSHSAVGSAASRLRRRGLLTRRRPQGAPPRIALTVAGRRWIERHRPEWL